MFIGEWTGKATPLFADTTSRLCPAYNTVLSEQLKKWYGKITPEVAIKYLTAVEMSGRNQVTQTDFGGDNHLAFYDLARMNIWVAFAAPHGVSGNVAAYARQFTKFDANLLLQEKY